jgi:hypothetical protein
VSIGGATTLVCGPCSHCRPRFSVIPVTQTARSRVEREVVAQRSAEDVGQRRGRWICKSIDFTRSSFRLGSTPIRRASLRPSRKGGTPHRGQQKREVSRAPTAAPAYRFASPRRDSSRYRYILSITEGISLPDVSISSAAATMAGMIASTRSTTMGCIRWPL